MLIYRFLDELVAKIRDQLKKHKKNFNNLDLQYYIFRQLSGASGCKTRT